MFWRRALSSSVTIVSGSGTSTFSSSASRTASRAAAACSRRLPRPSRSRTSAVSSSTVSNSEASWANSSSSSGSSCSCTWVTATVDLDVLADQVAADELGGEGLLVAGGQADQRLVETVDHAAAADLVGHAGHLGALDDLAVLGRLEVDDHEVAVGGGALDVDEGAEALTQRLDLLVDVGVGDLDVLDLGLEAVVVGQLDLGLDVDLGGELEGLVVLELGHLDLGLRQRLEVVGLERLDVLLRDDLVDRLVEDRAAADLAVDDRRRDLAAAEAGDVDLLGDLLVGRVEARLELLEGHLDGQLGPGRAQGLDGALHRFSPTVR